MLLEISLLIYLLCSIVFFVLLLRDKYVELNRVVILAYLMASIFWPITCILYIMDNEK